MPLKWLDENKTPYLNKTDRMLGTIDSLTITNREQIQTVTQWSESQIHNALNRIRQLGKSKEERNKWLISWQPQPRSAHVYTLGEKGIEHIKGLKDDALGFETKAIKGQVAHCMGTNEILCRVIKAGCMVDTWLSQKEVMSYLYYQLMPQKSPLRPDALIKVHGIDYFIEFDTGTESGGKIENKFHRYLKLTKMKGSLHPVVWVTISETRRDFLARKAQEAVMSFKAKINEPLPDKLPLMFAFVEGNETGFLSGSQTSIPIMGKS